MDFSYTPLSYRDLLQDFVNGLSRVFSGEVLPSSLAKFNMSLTLALLDIVHAVRENRPTQQLVARACAEFSRYAAGQETAHWPSTPTDKSNIAI